MSTAPEIRERSIAHGFTVTCESMGCLHCEPCGESDVGYHDENCPNARLIPCANGDGEPARASWADGRHLCFDCFEAMGPDPRYTAEENARNAPIWAEKRARAAEPFVPIADRSPPTPEQEALIRSIFGDGTPSP